MWETFKNYQKIFLSSIAALSTLIVVYKLITSQKDNSYQNEFAQNFQEQANKRGKKLNKQQDLQAKSENQSKEIFEAIVKGLSFKANKKDIYKIFKHCGNITEVKMIEKQGKFKGFAFVKFSNKNSLDRALELTETKHMDRTIVVEKALPKIANKDSFEQNKQNNNLFERKIQQNRQVQGQDEASIQTNTLFIGGLSYKSTKESIQQYFSQIDECSARVVSDKQTGISRGFGYVQFADVETAKKAYLSLNGTNLDGRNIRLQSAIKRDKPQYGDRQKRNQQMNGNKHQYVLSQNFEHISKQDEVNFKENMTSSQISKFML